MTKTGWIALSLMVFLLLPSCSAKKEPAVTPQQMAQFNLKLQEADARFLEGSYLGLKGACDAYRELSAFPVLRERTSEKFIKSALLLTLREKELAVIDHSALREAASLVEQNPRLAFYAPFIEAVEHIPDDTKGIIGRDESPDAPVSGDDPMDVYFDWVTDRVKPVNRLLREQSVSTDFFAYLYISFRSAFAFKFKEENEQDDFRRFSDIFPDSPLIGYKLLTTRIINPEAMQAWLADRPGFIETHLYLGDYALGMGQVLTAERHYLRAIEEIPESTSLAISLSKVYFHSEELERSLEYNDKALALAPNYRDALLGRAMCLAYLGRYQESLRALERMHELGKYYIGETYYWTAWNLNELERLVEAKQNIGKARDFLVGHNDVSTLDGIISYKQGRLDEAEQNFLESLRLQPADCDAAYYLGKTYADKKNWRFSGIYFEQGAGCQAGQEAAYEAKIAEIEASSMSRTRKDALIRKKKIQILQIRNTKATCRFNAAASYFNAKAFDKALAQAEMSVSHPSFRESAEELIRSIKQRKTS